MEIALRYFLATLPDLNQWPKVLPRLSQALANFTNFSSTNQTPTEVLFGFRTKEALDFLRVENGQSVNLIKAGDLRKGFTTDQPEPFSPLPASSLEINVDAYPVVIRSRRQ